MQYDIKDMGEVRNFLGIAPDKTPMCVMLHQSRYLSKMGYANSSKMTVQFGVLHQWSPVTPSMKLQMETCDLVLEIGSYQSIALAH